jgi:hypothetical protein
MRTSLRSPLRSRAGVRAMGCWLFLCSVQRALSVGLACHIRVNETSQLAVP